MYTVWTISNSSYVFDYEILFPGGCSHLSKVFIFVSGNNIRFEKI
jgi:hypothetical protein